MIKISRPHKFFGGGDFFIASAGKLRYFIHRFIPFLCVLIICPFTINFSGEKGDKLTFSQTLMKLFEHCKYRNFFSFCVNLKV